MSELAERNTEGVWRDRLRRFGPAFLVYVFATIITDSYFMADTADYVDSIVASEEGISYKFWEFGHLFWRPLGWLIYSLTKPLTAFAGEMNSRARVALVLVAINWLAGLLSVLLVVDVVRRIAPRPRWVVNLMAIAFIFTQGFLNCTQTGSSYVPGLAFLLLGLSLSLRGAERVERARALSLMAGVALSLSVAMWFLYVWAIPAALLAPLLLYGFDRRRFRFVLETSIACALFTGLAYAAVLFHLGIFNLAGLRAWIADSSHGNEVRGAARMIFGLARSFINMGNDGMLFKRFLLHDPFNPVTPWDLLRQSVWKLLLFYLFLLSVIIGLWRGKSEKRVLALLAAGSVPLIIFALFFDGGAVERYLPLYPYVALALGAFLGSERAWRPLKYLALAFIITMVLVNTQALSKRGLERQGDAVAARVHDLAPQLKPHSLVYVANWQDDLVNFSRSFPFHPINARRNNLQIDALVTPGTQHAAQWREDFAARVLKVWEESGDVWVSVRVLEERPHPEWNWVEGDERAVSWPDFRRFFSQLEMTDGVGGADGFLRLAPSLENERVLRPLAESINRNRPGR